MASVFPLEIYDIIITHVPDDFFTLNSLCLTSTAFVTYAQRRIFQLFRTDRWQHPAQPPSHLSPTKFLDRIIRRPHLAAHVREFITPFLPSSTHPADEQWLPLLIEALPSMVNLKSFTIFTHSTSPDALLQTLIECPFRLEELRWNWVIRNPDQNQTRLMSILLSQQTKILSLSLKMTPVSLPRDALPKLKSLATTCENVTAILPYRPPIDTLDCVYLDPDDPDFQPMDPDSPLVAPFRSVRRLCLGIGTMWFRNMTSYFPSLEVLQTSIVMASSRLYHRSVSSLISRRQVRDYHIIASSFPNLRTVHITRVASTNEQGMMSKWLFSSLLKLEYVIWGQPFSSHSPSTGHRYDCWTRSSVPTTLNARQVHERTSLLLLDRPDPSPSPHY